jgi:hypothetical protein
VEAAREAPETTTATQATKRNVPTAGKKVSTSQMIVWSYQRMRANASQDGNQCLKV